MKYDCDSTQNLIQKEHLKINVYTYDLHFIYPVFKFDLMMQQKHLFRRYDAK